ncbi:NADPH-dependent F420 reductase [Actinopolymorpha pittospori]|uniref:Dinucleotide-binding enzyme n=1 Tax=Actinopolymorpha pittospori TaxID=648752 RepID=A0A927RB70_9ACTN|nr:NAD(P)-binding domain-containing protein [Actinopolymorpha pittospori]MBE1608449.1 putative dinucleotide-binding enzyme [Actinopolymorpha pittospori]
MYVGFIGAGAISQAIATRLVASDVEKITLSNSRGPASLSGVVRRLGGSTEAGTAQQAAEADLTILSVPSSRVPAALAQVPDWTGRILVDTNNPIEAPTFVPVDLGSQTSSEVVAELAPGARVVKGLNHLAPPIIAADPHDGGGRRVAFYSGDDQRAKKTFAALLHRLGFEGIDLGPLATGGALHQFPGGPLPSRNLVQY